MSRLFNVNIPKAGANLDWAGKFLFALKELAVLAGFSVVGSGDGDSRFAYDGVTAALPGAQQGSGGSFDCWLTGASRGNSSPAVAGDAGNASAWIVLRDGAGRELLFAMTNQTAINYDGYARQAVARAGSGGFDGSVAAAAVIPGVPSAGVSSENWIAGTRASAIGSDWILYNDAGYVHMWADDSPSADGGLALGMFGVNSAGSSDMGWAVIPTVANQSNEDVDKAIYLLNQTGSFGAWDWASGPTYTWRLLNTNAVSQFWANGGQADPITGDTAIHALEPVTAINEVSKGVVHPTSPRLLPLARAWGFYGVDQNSLGWCSALSSSYVIPWPDAVTVPLP